MTDALDTCNACDGIGVDPSSAAGYCTPCESEARTVGSKTTTYTAQFRLVGWAKDFTERIEGPGFRATEVKNEGGGMVTFTGPDTYEYYLDVAETVGYYGSPPEGRRATLNGRPTPRSY